jgi:hypothetical protein
MKGSVTAYSRTNFHSDHARTTSASAYPAQFIPSFNSLVAPLAALGIEVVNITPDSALPFFRPMFSTVVENEPS